MPWNPEKPLEGLRRVVTGNDSNGKSIVTIDGPPAGALLGGSMQKIWATDDGYVDSQTTRDKGAKFENLLPSSSGNNVFWLILDPRDPEITGEELQARFAAGFDSIGAGHTRVDTSRDPGMHTTATIDYVVLLSGRVTLILDHEELILEPFEVVVQRGTNHAWVNIGKEPALLMAVLIDAEIR